MSSPMTYVEIAQRGNLFRARAGGIITAVEEKLTYNHTLKILHYN